MEWVSPAVDLVAVLMIGSRNENQPHERVAERARASYQGRISLRGRTPGARSCSICQRRRTAITYCCCPLYAEIEAEILQHVKLGELRGPKLKISERDVEREQ